jgi:uncharacterized membrane protein YphA (DoxX/SURF4 family)
MYPMHNLRLIRLSIALVWLYQGLWCKLLGRTPRHEAVVAAVPFLSAAQGHAALLVLGIVECGVAAWVLSGRRARESALFQTALLLIMNAGGVVWASRIIPDPAGMLFQNFTFLLLAWVAAGELRPYATHS